MHGLCVLQGATHVPKQGYISFSTTCTPVPKALPRPLSTVYQSFLGVQPSLLYAAVPENRLPEVRRGESVSGGRTFICIQRFLYWHIQSLGQRLGPVPESVSCMLQV